MLNFLLSFATSVSAERLSAEISAVAQGETATGMGAMTWNMMLGAGVLILTQVLVVGIAAAWLVRTQRKAHHDSSEASWE